MLSLFGIWAVVVAYYPEYHLVSIYNERLLGKGVSESLSYARLFFAIVAVVFYLYSFYADLFFRYANIALLIVLCGLLWIDLEMILLLYSFNDLMLPFFGLFAVKVVGVVLLWQNFRDVS